MSERLQLSGILLFINTFFFFLFFSAQVKLFVTGLFSLNQDIPAFKEHLRDFLVQIKVNILPGFIPSQGYIQFPL